MTEDLERFVDEAEHSIAARDWEAYGRLFAKDLLMVTPGLPGPTTGRDARVKHTIRNKSSTQLYVNKVL